MARHLTHKTLQIQNIALLAENIEIKLDYMLGLFKFGISFGKRQPRFLELICIIIHNMDFLSRDALPTFAEKLGLD